MKSGEGRTASKEGGGGTGRERRKDKGGGRDRESEGSCIQRGREEGRKGVEGGRKRLDLLLGWKLISDVAEEDPQDIV
eukprot:749876-Hanusia_phi.AAC.1